MARHWSGRGEVTEMKHHGLRTVCILCPAPTRMAHVVEVLPGPLHEQSTVCGWSEAFFVES